uniref:Uncharacterized protein n=1 Tax=Trieres chinensis TaxID=1514140 RepID=A0A7S1Z9Y7_TRICV|mmetsp:Transcript_21018/g.42397  ORF Transcript_21018/g.42397 Transcript_21018/m.42397 type:complete len:112 (+) Transcript_21018:68-403(+)
MAPAETVDAAENPAMETLEIKDLNPREAEDASEEDTEGESSTSNADDESQDDESEDDAEIEKDATPADEASNVLDELLDMFEAENGRAPTEEEMMKWIETFKSLSVSETES